MLLNICQNNTRYVSSQKHILDKYRNNEYCHIGDDDGNGKRFIRFLSVDKSKPPESTVRFDYRRNTGTNDIDDTVLMIQAEDFVNVPPRQRPHWQRYEILEREIK